MKQRALWEAWSGAVICVLTLSAARLIAAEKPVSYNREIRPILSENCFACHGPDKNQRKAKLRLDIRESALESEAFVPGKPDESELVYRVLTEDADDLMPPPDTHKTLTSVQKALLKRWVAEGAKYEGHWAYLPVTRPEEPVVSATNWVKNPIDRFVLAGLESAGLSPAPAAPMRTLVRRAHLDVIGLPPSPNEVAQAVAAESGEAYDAMVGRLLESPRYGERMAVPWLDVVRFADTVGYHGDQVQRIFPYRDYVIEAFNKNMRFDRFTLEQLAGDLLPYPTEEQIVATGFNRLNMMTREGGAQPGEYLAKHAADRVRTVSMAWLGSTMGCAECHDHKYDPFSTKDFYAMAAFFADIKQWGVYQDYGYTPNPDLRGWSNDHPFPPEALVDSPYLHRRIERLRQRAAEAGREAIAADPAGFDRWVAAARQFLQEQPEGWATPAPEAKVSPKKEGEAVATTSRVHEDRSVVLTGAIGDNVEVSVPVSGQRVSMIRLELLPDSAHRFSIVRAGENTVVAPKFFRKKGGGSETSLAIHFAEADRKEERYYNGAEILGVKDSWRTQRSERGSKQTAVYWVETPFVPEEGETLVVKLGGTAVGRFRVSVSAAASEGIPDAAWWGRLRDALAETSPNNGLLAHTYLASTGAEARAMERYRRLHRQILEARGGRAYTMITQPATPRVTRVLARGNWLDQSGEIVQPAVPHFLPQKNLPADRRLTRKDLAEWLVSKENPLTARTIMNRLWKQYFGAGLCSVLDDLGLQGDAPSHPELLDWLAAEFMESGWNVKHMVRLMVTSAAYRQTSNVRPELRDRDPMNRLLAYQNPKRLEGEFVRDNALAIAGLIFHEIGGPSAFPYQPPGYYAQLQFPDRDYFANKDEEQYRRGVYAHWQRTFLQPMLANFDAPAREECTAFRVVSNTPQQALTLLNDPTFTEAARVLAQSLLESGPQSVESRLEAIFLRTLARPPKAEETASLAKFLDAQLAHYAADKDEAARVIAVGNSPVPTALDPVALAAWTQAARVVLNLHETITAY